MEESPDENLISLYKSLKDYSGPKVIYKCEICYKIYQQKESFIKHLETKHTNPVSNTIKTEYCHICDTDFPTSAHDMPNFKFHIVMVHGNILQENGHVSGIQCKECLKQFSTKIYFRHHWETHRIDKVSVTCDKCNKDFPNMYLYKSHASLSHQDCVCVLCDKVFSGKSILRRHMMRHDNPLTCNYCYKEFFDEGLYKSHKEEHLVLIRNREKTFICEICGLSTSYKNVMRKHMMIHDSNSRTQCEECGKSFKTINSLKHHKSTIHTNKRFSCPTCLAGFAQKALLTKHIRLRHTKDPTLFESCPYCNKEMAKYQLGSHLLKHTKESPFECNICKDRFREKRTLMRHQSTYHQS